MRLLVPLLLTLSSFAGAANTSIQNLTVAFEARDAEYVSHGPGYSLSVTSGGAILKVHERALRMRLLGANPHALLEGFDRMAGRTNYILGADVRASFNLYGRVRSREVYPGTDLVFRGNQQRLEYDFEIAPGGYPDRIVLEFAGAAEIRIDRNGDLILRTAAGEIRQPKPVGYQIVAGRKTPVDVAYQLDAANHVRFRTGSYDRKRALVIDPELVFDNVFGGSAGNSVVDLARDAQGNIYVAGQTNSADFPVQKAAQGRPGAAPLLASADGGQTWSYPAVPAVRWIAAAPTTPSLLYAAAGSGVIKSKDGGTTWTTPANAGLTVPLTSIAVDAGSSSLLYGSTNNQGVFVSADGGATWNAANTGLAVFLSGALVSVVASPSKPGTVFALGRQPVEIYRSSDSGQSWNELSIPLLDRNSYTLSLSFSTDTNTLFLGQPYSALLKSTDGGDTWALLSNEPILSPQGLAVEPSNPSVLLAISTAGLQRSSDGGQTWATVLPLNFGSVVVDPRNSNTVFALDQSGLYRSADAGQTWTKTSLVSAVTQLFGLFVSPADSRVFVANAPQLDAFIAKWSPDGKQILYSTYLGGGAAESPTGIAVDSAGSAYIAGSTLSSDFPLTPNAFQKTLMGRGQNAFVSKLSPDGSQLIYSTLLGNNFSQTGRIAVDKNGNAVVAGSTPAGYKLGPIASCNGNSIVMSVPTTGNAFVAMIAADGGSLIYSAQLGGSCYSIGQGVGLDPNGNVWLTGSTTSPDFPVTQDALQPQFGGGVYDGFLARFDPSGNLAYGSYLGGVGYDVVNAITFDPAGDLYLTGSSSGLLQPASAGAFQPQVNSNCVSPRGDCSTGDIGPGGFTPFSSAFVAKLDPAAHAVLRLTYLGSYTMFGSSIALDSSGAPWIAGSQGMWSGAPPTTTPFQIGTGTGFISKFSADFTQLLFSSYFDSVGGFAIDAAGSAYVAGGVTPILIPGVLPAKAYVAKIDPTPPPISLDAVLSAVNSPFSGIAPGELLRILGKKMGPSAMTPGVIQAGFVAGNVAGVQVLFDGTPVPLLSVSAQEIDLMAPFELATRTRTTVQVQYNGVKSNPVQVGVTSTVMQVLSVFNEDFTLNSVSNPAKAGSVMTLYVSGLGQTNPPSQDGQVNRVPLPAPAMPLQVSSEPQNPNTILPVTFAGAAPGLVAGIFQINFAAPQQSVKGVEIEMGYARATFNVAVQ